ncbi:alpha/beta-hydrolase [Acephala macrosclerotiorum]|nr:alpha/beta-hydrolase [Acephala macrosclerotiorum]
MLLLLYLVLALFLALVYGALLGAPDSIGISQFELNQFELFAQYAGAAYCYDNIYGMGNTVACTAEGGDCPTVESAKPSILKGFFGVGETNTAGFVAIDNTNHLIIVAIQGTSIASNPIDILTDINLIRDKTDLCGTANTNDGCEIHSGFWQATNDVFPLVELNVKLALALHPDYQIVMTGHSLGGAVAALLGAKLRNCGKSVDIYTFGQPHLGSVDVSHYIQSQAPAYGSNYRITHTNDVVPQLPEHNWDSWDHFYPEFWIMKDSSMVKTSDMKVVTGALYETGGNEGDKSGLGLLIDIAEGLPAHFIYFGAISGCNPLAPGKL